MKKKYTLGVIDKLMILLEKIPKSLLMLFCFIVVVGLGVADYYVGPQLFFSLFYIAPVIIGSWFVGSRVGALLSVTSYIPWFIQDMSILSSYGQPILHFWNGIARLLILLIISHFSAVLRATSNSEKEMARIDALTGIANRRAFYEAALVESIRSRRFKKPLTMIYMDVDKFKEVNDYFGHHTGDDLLILIAGTIKSNLRATDTVARMGGDELAVLLPETDTETARGIIFKLKDKLMDMVKSRALPISFSVGAATFAAPPASIDEMIKEVDALMYSIKKTGGNNVRHEEKGSSLQYSVSEHL